MTFDMTDNLLDLRSVGKFSNMDTLQYLCGAELFWLLAFWVFLERDWLSIVESWLECDRQDLNARRYASTKLVSLEHNSVD